MRKKIHGDEELVLKMKSVRNDVKNIMGVDRYYKTIPDFIEMIKIEQKKLNCSPSRATMHIMGLLRIKFQNSGLAEGMVTSALVDGLENGTLDG